MAKCVKKSAHLVSLVVLFGGFLLHAYYLFNELALRTKNKVSLKPIHEAVFPLVTVCWHSPGPNGGDTPFHFRLSSSARPDQGAAPEVPVHGPMAKFFVHQMQPLKCQPSYNSSSECEGNVHKGSRLGKLSLNSTAVTAGAADLRSLAVFMPCLEYDFNTVFQTFKYPRLEFTIQFKFKFEDYSILGVYLLFRPQFIQHSFIDLSKAYFLNPQQTRGYLFSLSCFAFKKFIPSTPAKLLETTAPKLSDKSFGYVNWKCLHEQFFKRNIHNLTSLITRCAFGNVSSYLCFQQCLGQSLWNISAADMNTCVRRGRHLKCHLSMRDKSGKTFFYKQKQIQKVGSAVDLGSVVKQSDLAVTIGFADTKFLLFSKYSSKYLLSSIISLSGGLLGIYTGGSLMVLLAFILVVSMRFFNFIKSILDNQLNAGVFCFGGFGKGHAKEPNEQNLLAHKYVSPHFHLNTSIYDVLKKSFPINAGDSSDKNAPDAPLMMMTKCWLFIVFVLYVVMSVILVFFASAIVTEHTVETMRPSLTLNVKICGRYQDLGLQQISSDSLCVFQVNDLLNGVHRRVSVRLTKNQHKTRYSPNTLSRRSQCYRTNLRLHGPKYAEFGVFIKKTAFCPSETLDFHVYLSSEKSMQKAIFYPLFPLQSRHAITVSKQVTEKRDDISVRTTVESVFVSSVNLFPLVSSNVSRSTAEETDVVYVNIYCDSSDQLKIIRIQRKRSWVEWVTLLGAWCDFLTGFNVSDVVKIVILLVLKCRHRLIRSPCDEDRGINRAKRQRTCARTDSVIIEPGKNIKRASSSLENTAMARNCSERVAEQRLARKSHRGFSSTKRPNENRSSHKNLVRFAVIFCMFPLVVVLITLDEKDATRMKLESGVNVGLVDTNFEDYPCVTVFIRLGLDSNHRLKAIIADYRRLYSSVQVKFSSHRNFVPLSSSFVSAHLFNLLRFTYVRTAGKDDVVLINLPAVDLKLQNVKNTTGEDTITDIRISYAELLDNWPSALTSAVENHHVPILYVLMHAKGEMPIHDVFSFSFESKGIIAHPWETFVLNPEAKARGLAIGHVMVDVQKVQPNCSDTKTFNRMFRLCLWHLCSKNGYRVVTLDCFSICNHRANSRAKRFVKCKEHSITAHNFPPIGPLYQPSTGLKKHKVQVAFNLRLSYNAETSIKYHVLPRQLNILERFAIICGGISLVLGLNLLVVINAFFVLMERWVNHKKTSSLEIDAYGACLSGSLGQSAGKKNSDTFTRTKNSEDNSPELHVPVAQRQNAETINEERQSRQCDWFDQPVIVHHGHHSLPNNTPTITCTSKLSYHSLTSIDKRRPAHARLLSL